MINVIPATSVDSFDFLLFPEQHPANQQYIFNQLSAFNTGINEIGRKFLETSKAIYEKVNDSTAMRISKAALRMAKGVFHPNTIVEMYDIESTREAQPIMQRYIMAEPTIRALYQQQRCDGYSDTYSNVHGKCIGENHYDFKLVTDGMVFDTVDEDGEDSWKVNTYAIDLEDEDKYLTFDEKVNVLHTWEIIKMFIEQGNDPTDISGGNL